MSTDDATVTVRRATVADSHAIADIWYRGWREAHLGHVPDELVEVRTEQSFGLRASQRVADTVVAIVDAGVAGFVMVVDAEVEQVYVATHYRGTGVAARLLAEAERLVGINGYEIAWLAVVAGNTRARRFYERNGWTDAGLFEYPAAYTTGTVPVACHRYVRRIIENATR